MSHLLEIEKLEVIVSTDGTGRALVSGVSLTVERGRTTALVGESGSGKTLTARAVVGLLPRGLEVAQESRIRFDGMDLMASGPRELRSPLGTRIGMVFQDPVGSLNPVMRVADHLAEALGRRAGGERAITGKRSLALLDEVGLRDPERILSAWPHQLSGGMAQRVMIAIALAGKPDLLIADEPTASLDTTSQRGIIDLLRRLRNERGLATLLIAHDLGVVAELADRVAVIHAGQPAEFTDVERLMTGAAHPYSRGLVAAAIRLDRTVRPQPIPGAPTGTPIDVGCRFRGRCSHADARCASEFPEPSPDVAGRHVWCWHPIRDQTAAP